MGILQKKCRTTGKKALAYRGKGGQNTGTVFLALRLGVVSLSSKKTFAKPCPHGLGVWKHVMYTANLCHSTASQKSITIRLQICIVEIKGRWNYRIGFRASEACLRFKRLLVRKNMASATGSRIRP